MRITFQAQALAIDDSGIKNAPVGRRRKIVAEVAGRCAGFPARRHIRDITLLDLVAVHAVTARYGVALGRIWRGRASVIDLPIGVEVPVAFADRSLCDDCMLRVRMIIASYLP